MIALSDILLELKRVKGGIYTAKYKGKSVEVVLRSVHGDVNNHYVEVEVIKPPEGYEADWPVGKIVKVEGRNFGRAFIRVKTPNAF